MNSNGFDGLPGMKLPGVKIVTLRDIVAQIGALCDRIPGLAVVIIAGRKGDFENMKIMSNNLPYEMKREMVARVHAAFGDNAIKAES